MTTAVVSLIVSTPAYPDADPEGVAGNLRSNADMAELRARAIELLAQAGWVMQQPFVMGDSVNKPGDPTDYQDVVVYFRKGFATSDEGEADMRACEAFVDENFSFGWSDPGTVNDFGHPNCEWWGEGPSR